MDAVTICLLAVVFYVIWAEHSNKHIYKKAKEIDAYNGNHTAILGKYSVLAISSDKVTEEELNEWFWNYVAKNGHMYDLIVYTDHPEMGIHAHSGIVRMNVRLTKDTNGEYKDAGATKDTYNMVPDEDAHRLIRSGAQ